MTGAAPGPWPFVAGASVQGRDHRVVGRENQDAFCARVGADGQALVLAVSDGAGSQPRSALGSHIAVDSAVRVLGNGMPGADGTADRWQSWLSEGARAIVDDYLRIAAVAGTVGAEPGRRTRRHAGGGGCLPALGRIGVCRRQLRSRPDRRASGALPTRLPPRIDPRGTDFISSPWAKDMLRCLVLHDPELSGVVLATDGCAAWRLTTRRPSGSTPPAGRSRWRPFSSASRRRYERARGFRADTPAADRRARHPLHRRPDRAVRAGRLTAGRYRAVAPKGLRAMALRVITSQGRTLDLDARLDEGGEGVVYEVSSADSGSTALVAKLLLSLLPRRRRWREPGRRVRSPRMARLLAGRSRDGWPGRSRRSRSSPGGPRPNASTATSCPICAAGTCC